jgi:hypothetical protein
MLPPQLSTTDLPRSRREANASTVDRVGDIAGCSISASRNRSLEVSFSVEEEMAGELVARMTLGPDGRYRVLLDGERLTEVNLFSKAITQDLFK